MFHVSYAFAFVKGTSDGNRLCAKRSDLCLYKRIDIPVWVSGMFLKCGLGGQVDYPPHTRSPPPPPPALTEANRIIRASGTEWMETTQREEEGFKKSILVEIQTGGEKKKQRRRQDDLITCSEPEQGLRGLLG